MIVFVSPVGHHAGILGLAAFIEILHHAKHSAIGDDEMTVFWVTFSSHDVLPWVISGGLAVGGFLMARRSAPEMGEAYSNASTLEHDP